MKANPAISNQHRRNSAAHGARLALDHERKDVGAFTLVELLVVIGMLGFLGLILAPALAKARPVNLAFQCLNNLKQMTQAWRQWSGDNADNLLTCQNGIYPTTVRPNWVLGNLDWNGSNSSNSDTNRDLVRSPLWPYVGAPGPFRCPADQSAVYVSPGTLTFRVRSYSMSQVFSRGEWLEGAYNQTQTSWRTYAKGAEIVIPSHTFLFVDENAGCINDGAFAAACTGNQPTDVPGSARLIDLPSNRHNFGATFSFADGHGETHRWTGSLLQSEPNYNGFMPQLNIAAGTSWPDAHWLAANTTVHNP